MPLSEFKESTETVEFKGGSFEVRAITLPDVALLIEVHEDVISSLVMKVREKAPAFEAQNAEDIGEVTSQIITDLIRESPTLVATLISRCADEPDQMGNASRLPISVQIDAISKIAKLTFTDMASVKKLIADVMSIVSGILPPKTSAAA